eukprot:409482_1
MTEEQKDLHVTVNQASWIIQNDLMAKFRNANNGEEFTANFLLHGCSWKIKCYPNGKAAETIDHFSVFVECKTLPNGCSKLGVTYQIDCVEANQVETTSDFFVEGTQWGWPKFMKGGLIMEKLTINIKVFSSVTVDQGCLIWKIDGYLLDMFKTCTPKK